ncbi:MAG: hypothetical protein Q8R40_04890 [bacterium]|nr:hypothetical protein [bacterium]
MKTEIGEYIVGAWLKIVQKCDFVSYNVRPPTDGREALGELDVIGLDLRNKKVFICEVVTHIHGLGYYDLKTTLKKIEEKFLRQQNYAKKFLPEDFEKHYMLWSPIVTPQYEKAIKALLENTDLKLIINSEYSKKVDQIQVTIKGNKKDFGNPFVRVLQILEVLKCSCGSGKKYKKCCN